MNEIANTNYMNELADNIVKLVQNAKAQLATSVNSIMTETYWNIGKYIIEVEQDGKATSIYGSKLLTNLSHEPTLRMGKGHSRPSLNNMRKFYLRYPNCQTVSDNLSWSHICELITIDDDLERKFRECSARLGSILYTLYLLIKELSFCDCMDFVYRFCKYRVSVSL